ncbi:MAG: polymer-forming cytoskeletal protein [Clostridia bacterium]|nr:polymer-forming cytoskeletal protein [Clostridia bacterium]
MTDRYIIGQNIAALRKEAGLTQTELADRLHVSHQAISQWERGETLPDILTLPALAEIFGRSAGVLLGMEEMLPAECRNSTTDKPVPADSGIQTENRFTGLAENCDYTVVLEKNGVRVQQIPADIRKQVIIILEGNCRNLTSAFTTEIRGNVEGNAAISGGANIEKGIGGDAAISGGATICGDIEGDCGISGGASISGSVNGDLTLSGGGNIGGSINGDAVFSGQAVINGSVNSGDVTTDSPLTICGNVEGDILVHDGSDASVTVQGSIEGDIMNCSDLTVEGDINGDVDCGDLTVGGGIAGDVDCDDLTVDGDIAGDVDCCDLEIHGSIAGDIDCTDCHVEGDINGNVDCTDCHVEGRIRSDEE